MNLIFHELKKNNNKKSILLIFYFNLNQVEYNNRYLFLEHIQRSI